MKFPFKILKTPFGCNALQWRNTEPNKIFRTNRNQISSMRNIEPWMQVVFINPASIQSNLIRRQRRDREAIDSHFLAIIFVLYMFSLSAIHTDNTLMVFAIENSIQWTKSLSRIPIFSNRYDPSFVYLWPDVLLHT